ncbi:MAG TPA: GyrI-like domain-containing protein [Bacteroidales bacterium]|nr:GyrI-like domain-containing protein [Bacteroidales bacterium]
MKFIKWFLIIIVSLIAALLVVAAFLPKEMKISAETDINLPRTKVFRDVVSFTDRSFWDPWISIDSTAETSVDFEDMYAGTRFSWTGKVVGTGEITVDSTDFGNYISSTIRFGGQKTPAKVTWRFKGDNQTTHVIWTFQSSARYPLGRYALLFLKKQIKKRYTRGLENLSKRLDQKDISLSSLSGFTIVNRPEMSAMIASASGDMKQVTAQFDSLFASITRVVSGQSLEVTGPPFSYFFDLKQDTGNVTVYCGLPVRKTGQPAANVSAITFPSFRAVKAIHTGPYDELPESYRKMMAYITKNHLKATGEAWEFYLTDPQVEPIVTSWKTEIYLPVE